MSFCGRLWKSTCLLVVLLLSDGIALFAGLGPFRGEHYWTSAQLSIWHEAIGRGKLAGTISASIVSTAMLATWIMRILCVGKAALLMYLVICQARFQSRRYQGPNATSQRMLDRMGAAAPIRLMLTLAQGIVFWLAWYPTAVAVESSAGIRRIQLAKETIQWARRSGIVGTAPLAVTASVGLDVAVVGMIFYYRHKYVEWSKYNAELSAYFA